MSFGLVKKLVCPDCEGSNKFRIGKVHTECLYCGCRQKNWRFEKIEQQEVTND